MNRSTSWWIAGAGILTLALLCYPVTALTVRSAGEKGLLWAVPASTGTQFRLTWIHSVSKRPVAETYVVSADAKLCLTEMVFDHEGPGMPSSPEGETTWRIEGGKVFVTGYSSCLDRLDLGVAPFGHRLLAGAWDIDLVAGIGPDRLVSVGIERTLLILIILAEVRQWILATPMMKIATTNQENAVAPSRAERGIARCLQCVFIASCFQNDPLKGGTVGSHG